MTFWMTQQRQKRRQVRILLGPPLAKRIRAGRVALFVEHDRSSFLEGKFPDFPTRTNPAGSRNGVHNRFEQPSKVFSLAVRRFLLTIVAATTRVRNKIQCRAEEVLRSTRVYSLLVLPHRFMGLMSNPRLMVPPQRLMTTPKRRKVRATTCCFSQTDSNLPAMCRTRKKSMVSFRLIM